MGSRAVIGFQSTYPEINRTLLEIYSKSDSFNSEPYKLAVRMATRFAEGAYDQVIRLNQTPAGTTGKYKEFSYIASNNLAYHLATLEYIEKKKDSATADKVRKLIADTTEFREKCWRGEYAYPWYELEETSVRVKAVFGDANDTAEARTRFLNLLENTYVPHDWRLRIRIEYDRTGIFPIDPPVP